MFSFSLLMHQLSYYVVYVISSCCAI